MYKSSQNSVSSHSSLVGGSLEREFTTTPLHFIDIGARGGVHDLVVPVAEWVSVLGFEADPEECERLSKLDDVSSPWAAFQLLPFGLSDRNGEQTLHLTRANTNHSLLPPNDAFVSRYNMKQFEKTGEAKVPVKRLDDIYHERKLDNPNFGEFIKIDTQGSEFEILNGSESVLCHNTVALVCEVSFFEIYRGQKLFSEVESYLRKIGFSFYGFDSSIHTRSRKFVDKRSHTTRERAMYADAIFLKDPCSLPPGTLGPRQIKALYLCSLLLGHYDFALELARDYMEASEYERRSISSFVGDLSLLPADSTLNQLKKNYQEAINDPANANLIVGRFVDSRRKYCDYDDVANVSQHIHNLH